MKHAYFKVTNYKGIPNITLDLTSHPKSSIYTLVGLNESGKTTILEALNFLSFKPENLDPLDLPGYSVKDVHELIPINKRSNFNDSITVSAGYTLDEHDLKEISEFARKNLGYTSIEPFRDLEIAQSYQFINSQLAPKQPTSKVHPSVNGKKKGAKTVKPIVGEDLACSPKTVP